MLTERCIKTFLWDPPSTNTIKSHG
jgi:hypothetical protein